MPRILHNMGERRITFRLLQLENLGDTGIAIRHPLVIPLNWLEIVSWYQIKWKWIQNTFTSG